MLAPSQRKDLEETKTDVRDTIDEECANCWVCNEMDLGEVACREGNYLQPEQSNGSAPPLPAAVRMAPASSA